MGEVVEESYGGVGLRCPRYAGMVWVFCDGGGREQSDRRLGHGDWDGDGVGGL